jgi:CheY-like chemotaxis protein
MIISFEEFTRVIPGYIGGQIEIKSPAEKFIYRGEIETIAIVDNQLRIKLKWSAKGESFPPLPKSWQKDDNLFFSWSPKPFNDINDIGADKAGGGHRLCISSFVSDVTATIFPPNGSKLDPATVVGLQPAGKPKILIAENENKWQNEYKLLLENKYQVLQAYNISQAAQLFTDNPDIVLIIMDACLNNQDEMDVESLVTEILKSFQGPIIAATNSDYCREKLLNIGCSQAAEKNKAVRLARRILEKPS